MSDLNTKQDSPNGQPQTTQNSDLGLGAKLTEEATRLILKDGKINVRKGYKRSDMDRFNIYQDLLSVSWLKFLLIIVASYIIINAIFALLYMLVGVENFNLPAELADVSNLSLLDRFTYSFYFSAQTFTTVGYGHISPAGNIAHLLATFEAMVGLLGFALITGVLYGRFSRPTAKIAYSDKAIIAPYHGINSFQVKLINKRQTQLLEVEATVVLMGHKEENGVMKQIYFPLTLEREKITLFPLNWTIVHPIDEDSPMHGMTAEDLEAMGAEFLILIKGYDETFCQTVHSRISYTHDEIEWGQRFVMNWHKDENDGALVVEIDELGKRRAIELN